MHYICTYVCTCNKCSCIVLKTYELIKTGVPDNEDEKSALADSLSQYDVSLLEYIRSLSIEK